MARSVIHTSALNNPTKPNLTQTILYNLPSPQVLHFRTLVEDKGERETRVTRDTAQGITGRGKKRGEASLRSVSPVLSFPPSFELKFTLREQRQEQSSFTAISVTLSGNLCDEVLEQYG